MRLFGAALLAAMMTGALVCGPVRADWVPPLKGNDTGGIISYSLAATGDIRMIAADHCARYGKVATVLGVQAFPGGYISFACRWVPYGPDQPPLQTRY